MFKDIFPMMATHQMELDDIVQNILRKIPRNGQNASITISVPSHFSEDDRRYVENELKRQLMS